MREHRFYKNWHFLEEKLLAVALSRRSHLGLSIAMQTVAAREKFRSRGYPNFRDRGFAGVICSVGEKSD